MIRYKNLLRNNATKTGRDKEFSFWELFLRMYFGRKHHSVGKKRMRVTEYCSYVTLSDIYNHIFETDRDCLIKEDGSLIKKREYVQLIEHHFSNVHRVAAEGLPVSFGSYLGTIAYKRSDSMVYDNSLVDVEDKWWKRPNIAIKWNNAHLKKMKSPAMNLDWMSIGFGKRINKKELINKSLADKTLFKLTGESMYLYGRKIRYNNASSKSIVK